MRVDSLGAQKQVLGGGSYKEGVGFAFGIDRILIIDTRAINDDDKTKGENSG